MGVGKVYASEQSEDKLQISIHCWYILNTSCSTGPTLQYELIKYKTPPHKVHITNHTLKSIGLTTNTDDVPFPSIQGF
jgi:hypothetical protein